jgi:hypothetical protein
MTLKEIEELAGHRQVPAWVVKLVGDALAAQKKEWVGLTKEEAKEITLANRPYVIDVVAALEAKLKEKNHG